MKGWFASLFLVAALSSPAVAQSAAEPTQSQLTAARELLKITNVEGVMRGSLESQADLIKQQIQKNLPQATPERIESITRITREETEKAIPHLLDESTKIYARHFSEEDLRGLIAFYQTPLGKTLVAKLPAVSREMAQVSAELAGNILVRLRQEMPKLQQPPAPEQKP